MEAENLKAMDMNGYSDPYVVLGDEYHKRLGKTRIVYNNLNPRWEETFDITTTGPILLIATLWDWDTVGDHDCLGRTSLKLDPTAFSDFQAKEQWIDLDSQGRLLLRISMEGERDDIQFHFGKAFRTLKRTERDMTRQITDKVRLPTTIILSKLTNNLALGLYPPLSFPLGPAECHLKRLRYIGRLQPLWPRRLRRCKTSLQPGPECLQGRHRCRPQPPDRLLQRELCNPEHNPHAQRHDPGHDEAVEGGACDSRGPSSAHSVRQALAAETTNRN